MVSASSLLTGCVLVTGIFSLPTPDNNTPAPVHQITADQIIAIDPTTANCDGAAMPAECAPASRAAPALTAAFAKYNICAPGTQAALIALMLFESGSFKYNHNHFPAPGRPGQGTRNMQMADFNDKYATSLFGAAEVQAAGAKAAPGVAAPDAVLALLNQNDEYSFGSAAWFLTSQCTETIQAGLATGTPAGWEAFLTECVKTTHDPARDESWNKAKAVLGAA